MKKPTIKTKVTLWYTALVLVVISLTLIFMLFVSNSLLETQTQKRLVKAVENNVDEVEYNDLLGVTDIEDDFYFIYDNVYCLVYDRQLHLLDGQFPPGFSTDEPFSDGEIKVAKLDGETYYIYDRLLTPVEYEYNDDVWVRGVIKEEDNDSFAKSIVKISFIMFPLLMLITAAGGWFIAKKSFEPVRKITDTVNEISHDGDLKKRVGITEDDDEIKTLAVTFDSMLDRLDKSFEAEKQFTSDASHELRTPVSVILGECELALDGEKAQEEYVQSIKVIERQTKRISKLISQLLSFTRLEQGVIKPDFEHSDLSETVLAVCAEQEYINDASVKLTTNVDNDIYADFDIGLITRLITNLVSNAYKYNTESGSITVSLHENTNSATLTVSDTGIGIDSHELQKIWQRFYRCDSSRSSNGLGLGLAMVKQISDLHDGTLNVKSEKGCGTEFIFTLPKKRK